MLLDKKHHKKTILFAVLAGVSLLLTAGTWLLLGCGNYTDEEQQVQQGIGVTKSTTGVPSGNFRDMKYIRSVVMQRIGGVKNAYDQRLREKPGLRGKITTAFTIDQQGNVTDCSIVSSNINDTGLEDMLKRIIKQWTFPPVEEKGEVKVVYPFIFAPPS